MTILKSDRLITFPELKQRGLRWTRDHLRLKCDRNEFPKPIALSPRRIAWVEREVDQWIADRIAERDQQGA
jgi:prophage regulatory protein